MKSKSKTKIMKFSWFQSLENHCKRKLILNIHTLTVSKTFNANILIPLKLNLLRMHSSKRIINDQLTTKFDVNIYFLFLYLYQMKACMVTQNTLN